MCGRLRAAGRAVDFGCCIQISSTDRFCAKALSCGFLGGGGSSHVKPRGGSEAPSLLLLSGKLHPWIYYCRIFKYTRPYIQLTPSVGATALALLSL